MSATTHAAAKIAARTRHHPHDTATLVALRQELEAARVEDRVRQLTAAVPPLTEEQRTRIIRALVPAGANGKVVEKVADAPRSLEREQQPSPTTSPVATSTAVSR